MIRRSFWIARMSYRLCNCRILAKLQYSLLTPRPGFTLGSLLVLQLCHMNRYFPEGVHDRAGKLGSGGPQYGSVVVNVILNDPLQQLTFEIKTERVCLPLHHGACGRVTERPTLQFIKHNFRGFTLFLCTYMRALWMQLSCWWWTASINHVLSPD